MGLLRAVHLAPFGVHGMYSTAVDGLNIESCFGIQKLNIGFKL